MRHDPEGLAVQREREAALRASLNYERAFRAAGESYSEADEDGNLIVHHPPALDRPASTTFDFEAMDRVQSGVSSEDLLRERGER